MVLVLMYKVVNTKKSDEEEEIIELKEYEKTLEPGNIGIPTKYD